MKFLHTADWHIGKKLKGSIERLQEQEDVLHEIVSICEREKVEVVLVAGDIYDVSTPSADAVEVLHKTLAKLAENGRLVILISGNHDDPIRLANPTIFSEKEGIYFYGNIAHEHLTQPHRKGVKVLQAEANYMIVSNDKNEEVYIHILPYPTETRFKEDRKEQESYLEKMTRWIEKGAKNDRNLPSIFLSHLFVMGGECCEEERELGSAKLIPLEYLPKADYVALGHIHKRQQWKDNIRYSGSILQYSFDERVQDKQVVVFSLDATNRLHAIEEIPLSRGIPLKKLQATDIESAIFLLKENLHCYVDLTLYLHAPLSKMQLDSLQKTHPRLVNITPILAGEKSFLHRKMHSREALPASEMFIDFYERQYAKKPDEKLVALFVTLLGECDET